MSIFNEDNTVEKMVIQSLVNNGWKYIPSEELPREYSDVLVEPMVKEQWFVKMDHLSEQLQEIQKNLEKKVNFVPDKFENIFLYPFYKSPAPLVSGSLSIQHNTITDFKKFLYFVILSLFCNAFVTRGVL